jgi:hypothetical protein
MKKSNTNRATRFSPRASLVAIGAKIRSLKLFEPIKERVKIGQKTIKHTPTDKLMDALITILAGAAGMVEVNTRLRTDTALQRAFGRESCAEQSVVQQTLDAATAVNICEMEQAMDEIIRNHSKAYKHNFSSSLFIIDADLTGLPCGKKAAFATRGYFNRKRNRRGRQMGRVIASQYEEVITDKLYKGSTQLCQSLQELISASERTLELNEEKRHRTVVRVDRGGGSNKDVNWLLERGYHFHGKDYSAQRTEKIVQSVKQWIDDPLVPTRQVGWIEEGADYYIKPVKRIAVRCRKQNGQWAVGAIISTLSEEDVIKLTNASKSSEKDPEAVLLSYVYLYDQRGGTIEEEIKEDKQGLSIGKRNKKRFEAQQLLMMLAQLAHNVIVWSKSWIATQVEKITRIGIKRMVRDIFQVTGKVEFDTDNRIVRIVLNSASQWSRHLAKAFKSILMGHHIAINLDEI